MLLFVYIYKATHLSIFADPQKKRDSKKCVASALHCKASILNLWSSFNKETMLENLDYTVPHPTTVTAL